MANVYPRDHKIKPVKNVYVGMLFTGVTHGNRAIPLGKVVAIDAETYRSYPHRVVWYDDNGKHYENFCLSNPALEFREFKIINEKEEV